MFIRSDRNARGIKITDLHMNQRCHLRTLRTETGNRARSERHPRNHRIHDRLDAWRGREQTERERAVA